MKEFSLITIMAFFLNLPLVSQQDSGRGFNLYRDLVYLEHGNQSLQLDLYTPDGSSMPGGIGVEYKESNEITAHTDNEKEPVPVLLWLTFLGTDKFPIPVAGFVGNGYAIVSLGVESDSTSLADIAQAIQYLEADAEKFKLNIEKIGIIQQSINGYLAAIWHKDMQNYTSITDAELKLKLAAPKDSNFSQLQLPENSFVIISFFDKYLRNGVHTESDPLTLKCPPDSWIDPITNPIPGTSYHLFPTSVRGENTKSSYLIYLPEDYYTSNKRYPVIYWLHGGNGNSREGRWICEQMNTAMQRGDMPQTIMVFVQGLPIGWYNNSKDGTMPVEDVIIKDLIPHIDNTYRTISKREARGIEGMSMGGYGSLHLGFKYPGLFGVVSSIAPSITTFEMERKEIIVPTFDNDTAYFNANSPSTLVQKNADYIKTNSVIRLLTGDKDFLYELIREFHHQLQNMNINHQYAIARDADHDYKEVINKLDFNTFIFWQNLYKE